MTDIRYTIEPDDVEWEMDWSGTKADGSRMYPDKPEKEMIFEEAPALALLLLNEVIHTNDHWWEKDWPEKARNSTFLGVNCSDVFAWGSSDSEELEYSEIKAVYQMWKKDPSRGSDIWCIIKRKEMPQRPVEKRIREAGIWDLDALKTEHGLRNNFYDGVSLALAHRKYTTYCAWEGSQGRMPRPFDAQWWSGWREYTEANPGWNDEAWKAGDIAIRQQWMEENGYEQVIGD